MTARSGLASLLASISGLDYQVAFNWLTAENSDFPSNPLGILSGNSRGSGLEVGRTGRFAAYASDTDGIRAAWWLLQHGPYGGIRAAIKTKNPALERQAIVNSPWAGGHYVHGKGFPTTGIAGAAGSSGGGGIPPSPVGIPVSAPAGSDADKLRAALQAAGISTDPSHVLTEAEAMALTRKVYPLYRGAQSLFRAGDTVAQILQMTTVGSQLPNPADLFGAIFAWVPGTAANLAVLIGIGILAYVGLRSLADGLGSSTA